MKKFANYIGRKYGLLTVIDCIASSDGNNNGGLWLCKCRCGKTITLGGYKLYHRESCGCKNRKAARERGINNRHPESVTFRIEYSNYRREFKGQLILKLDQWKAIVQGSCHYCGDIDLRNSALKESYKTVIPLTEEEQILYQISINEIVEIEGTLISCCNKCKKMRGKLSHAEFIRQIQLITKRLKNK